MVDLKKIAEKMAQKINDDFKDNSAKVLDERTAEFLTAKEYLKLPSHLAKALALPGLPFGQITQAYGKKDSSKSSLAMQCIKAAIEQDILPVLILTEEKFSIDRMKKFMGCDPTGKMLIFSVSDLEEGFEKVDSILQDLAEGVYGDTRVFFVWDSIGGTGSEKELEYGIRDHDKDMGRFAQGLKKMTKRIWQRIRKSNEKAGMLVLNQVWDDRSFNGITTERPYGGQSVQHYYALEIHLKRKKQIKMSISGIKDVGIGYEIELRVIKNHLSPLSKKTSLAVVASGLITIEDIPNFKKTHLPELRKFLSGDDSEKP